MGNKIVDVIASDLGIEKIHSESDNQFCARTMYSAMSQWVKEITLQNCAEQSTCSKGIVTRQSAEKFITLYEAVPEAIPWFANIDLTELARYIREHLESVGEILVCDFDNRISLCNNYDIAISDESTIVLGKYTNGLCRATGLGLLSDSIISKGVTSNRFNTNTNRLYEISAKNGDRVYDVEGYEVFDPTVQKQSLSECWIDAVRGIRAGENIIRKKQAQGPGNYLHLQVYKNGLMKTIPFDEYLIKSKDYSLYEPIEEGYGYSMVAES